MAKPRSATGLHHRHNDRGEVAGTGVPPDVSTGQEALEDAFLSGHETGVVVHREIRLKRQRFLVVSVRMGKSPTTLTLPLDAGMALVARDQCLWSAKQATGANAFAG